MALDDRKKGNFVKVSLTDTEYHAVKVEAAQKGHKLAPLVRQIVRVHMLGHKVLLPKSEVSLIAADSNKYRTLEVKINESDFINLAMLGHMKRNTMEEQLQEMVEDYLNGHLQRINDAQALRYRSFSDL